VCAIGLEIVNQSLIFEALDNQVLLPRFGQHSGDYTARTTRFLSILDVAQTELIPSSSAVSVFP
jgi:hypothetical protein